MKKLSHNGIIIPKYKPKGFSIKFKGRSIKLSPEQEEMAVAWVRKLGTVYAEDKVFVRNFFNDFCQALGIKKSLSNDFDFSDIKKYIDRESEAKLNLSKEEKKKVAAERKAIREANKEKYGFVMIDDERVDLGNYMAEPSSIFMGRGKHPLRGKWKGGAKESDVVLNLSPDSKTPPGNWKTIVWQPECMWIAKWNDSLRGKEKYIWVADSSSMKQQKEIKKFEMAKELEKNHNIVHNHIIKSLDSDNLKTRKIATVCYLIENVCMRVGDEKDEDEANTVGATTLTRNNITILPNNVLKFDFLGKDYVRWKKEAKVPESVARNLKEFIKSSDKTIFEGIRSEHMNAFLSEAMEGLTTKVFRTCSATKAVREFLNKNKINKEKSECYKKRLAKLANLEAAKVCNHKRTIPKNWQDSLNRKRDKLEAKKIKSKHNVKNYKQKIADFKKKYEQQISRYENILKEQTEKLEQYKKEMLEKEKQSKNIKGTRRKLSYKKKSIKNLKLRIRNLKKNYTERMGKLKIQMSSKKQRDQESIKKLEFQIEEQRKTKDYNLNTSLKSYVDPRTYEKWAKKVVYDWKKYYSKSLQHKFSWVEKKTKK